MIFQSPKNPNSHQTVKERIKPSLPVKVLLERNLIQGRVLDFGCGLGMDLKHLNKIGFETIGYDPYYQPEYPKGKFDTIICFYVLNVLLPIEQSHVLMAISELLKPGGRAFYAVRRDVRRNGFRYNPKRECNVYQCNVTLNFKSIFRTKYCEMYEYQHFNQIKKNNECVFCNPSPEQKLITETATAYSIFNLRPDLGREMLVVPKRHCDNFSELSEKGRTACKMIVNRVKKYYSEKFQPVKFNVEILDGSEPGESGKHAYIRIVPIRQG
ncbi:MAG TPA: methyltransferase domain-containing protein [Bacteroidetes bacterium]|nr:methyltransferase domain-containing protein [Bacteroidota bacterium]